MWRIVLAAGFLSTPAVALAQSAPDLEREKAELLRLHRNDRDAHFRTNLDLLQDRSPDTMISVSRGQVHRVTKVEQRRFFREYFRGATYQAWDAIEEPIVRVSNDASMAWIITRLQVRRLKRLDDGSERAEGFVYAGIMT
jgi:hypothetical protein